MCFPLMNSDMIGQAEHALSVTSLPADLPDPWEQQAVFCHAPGQRRGAKCLLFEDRVSLNVWT